MKNELFCLHKTCFESLCRQIPKHLNETFYFLLKSLLSYKQWQIVPNWPLLGSIRRILSHVTASGYIFRSTFRSLSDVLFPDECRAKKAFQHVKRMFPLFRAVVNFFVYEMLCRLCCLFCSSSSVVN